jgi:hypothetical protein
VIAAVPGALPQESQVTPGLLGFAVVVVLGVATWLLVRSLGRRLKKISIPRGDDNGDDNGDDKAPEGNSRDENSGDISSG